MRFSKHSLRIDSTVVPLSSLMPRWMDWMKVRNHFKSKTYHYFRRKICWVQSNAFQEIWKWPKIMLGQQNLASVEFDRRWAYHYWSSSKRCCDKCSRGWSANNRVSLHFSFKSLIWHVLGWQIKNGKPKNALNRCWTSMAECGKCWIKDLRERCWKLNFWRQLARRRFLESWRFCSVSSLSDVAKNFLILKFVYL